MLVRIVHGLATAIYGPVTLAYVVELSTSNRAERLGWFSMARNAGYVVGPAAAGVLLLRMDPVHVFTVVGLLSSLAFVPIALLPETKSAPQIAEAVIRYAGEAGYIRSRPFFRRLAGRRHERTGARR